jgi:hypothetical protein
MLIGVGCCYYPVNHKVFENDSKQREAFLHEIQDSTIELGRLELLQEIPHNFRKDIVSARAFDVLSSLLALVVLQLSYSETRKSGILLLQLLS